MSSPPSKIKILLKLAKKPQNIAIKPFPAARYSTRILELASNIPQLIVDPSNPIQLNIKFTHFLFKKYGEKYWKRFAQFLFKIIRDSESKHFQNLMKSSRITKIFMETSTFRFIASNHSFSTPVSSHHKFRLMTWILWKYFLYSLAH